MNISQVLETAHGAAVSFNGVLVEKVLQPTKTDSLMLNITLADVDGRVSFPVFSSVEELNDELEEGKAYKVDGIVNIWNGKVQIKSAAQNKSPVFRALETSEYEPTDFVGRYEIPSTFIKIFVDTVSEIKEPYRDIVIEATGCMGRNSDRWEKFITSPSAEKHHGNKLGGLFLHTLGVLSNIMNIIKLYEKFTLYGDLDGVLNKDRMIAKAILHDVEKISEYEYDTCIRRIPGVVGHLFDGVSLVTEVNNRLGNPLDRDELENLKYSILSHHGQYGPCEPKSLEDMLLHLSDMVDSRVVGELEKKK